MEEKKILTDEELDNVVGGQQVLDQRAAVANGLKNGKNIFRSTLISGGHIMKEEEEEEEYE